jgi:hypothetical protein
MLCAAKIYKMPIGHMNSEDEKGYERESKILKEAKHPFIIEYIDEFPY